MRVVGIGASAGGLVALEDFFSQLQPAAGLAYVVVQHLDPTHKAVLAELLQRVTRVPVVEARAGMRVEADHAYVIPPNTEISITGGLVQLAAPSEPRGLRMPINVLFSSLARGQGAHAIGVVLSGMGADGTLGLQAIKAVGGLSIVQEPGSAQFDSMPRAAIAAGCADIVALPADMPTLMRSVIQRETAWPAPAGAFVGGPAGAFAGGPAAASVGAPAGPVAVAPSSAPAADAAPVDAMSPPGSELQDVLELLRLQTRHDFSLYKPSTVNRRVQRRMAIHSHATVAQYTQFARRNPQELDLLFKELLIGVTNFFRDPALWHYLADTALPALLAQRGERTLLRAWVAGCSTGEEAYSLAIVFAEVIERLPEHRGCRLQIFASDLSADAIATARAGRYPGSIAGDVVPERLARFFRPQGVGNIAGNSAGNGAGNSAGYSASYSISKAVRESVLFALHNVMLDPPFTRLDVLCCRNLLIYFDAALQRRVLPLFHYSLRPGGLLVLGSSETVGPFNRLFEPVESKLRLYRRPADAGANAAVLMKSFPPLSHLKPEPAVTPALDPVPAADSPVTLQAAADNVLLQMHAPPAVVVSAGGDIVYISGRTGRYLEPAAGKANWNFHAMVQDSLREPVAVALAQALAQAKPVLLRGLALPPLAGVPLPGPGPTVDILVQPLAAPAALDGMLMIVFREHAAPLRRSRRKKGVNAPEATHTVEVQQLRDEIQTLREETHASREELQSANEELQSTNEELQSTNEELTTSKEEMQSMNEELRTVNHELVSRADEMVNTADDMNNLINSTQVATLFLDAHLGVRRFTPATACLIKLIPSDLGRPITDLVSALDYPELADDAREVLRTLVDSVRDVPASDGRWYAAHLMPYRTQDNRIDGVVITFSDIAMAKALEHTFHDAQQLLARHAADESSEPDATRQVAALLRHANELVDKQFIDQQRDFMRAGAGLRSNVSGSKS